MTSRTLASISGAVVTLVWIASPLLGQAPSPTASTSQTRPQLNANGWKALRTPNGQPDLQGVWDFATVTPLERPKEFADKAVLTEAEAAAFEKRMIESNNVDDMGPQSQGGTGTYNEVWWDRGTKVVGTRRTSLIIDPPDGKIPPLTEAARTKRDAIAAERKGIGTDQPTPGGWVEDLGPANARVRCILGFNSGPPMTPIAYNNNMQIVQAPGYVVIVNEMIHSPRFVPLDGRPRGSVRRWVGESRGRWEGEMLVVETQNFLGETVFAGGMTSAHLRLTERFTRVGPDTLVYEFTVDDPTVYTRPWTVQMTMTRSDEYMYEYACHEGNVALAHILSGARAEESRETPK